MITVQDVSFGYDGRNTVENLSFSIKQGTFAAIIGENGAGKTTISKLIRGLLTPTHGKVIVNGIDLQQSRPSSLASKIGFLFQNPDRQICCSTVQEELIFSLVHAGVPRSMHDALCTQILNDFSLDGCSNPFHMSRGERQRVALASVLVSNPELLILDEPTTGMDYSECISMMNLIKERNKSGVTVLMVCHDMEIVLDYADRVLVMNHGHLIADGTPVDIFYDDEIMQQASIIPPQIIGLSSALNRRFGMITSVDEMTSAVTSAAAIKKAGVM